MLSQDNVNIIYYIYKAVYGKRVYATYTCQSLGEIRVTTHNIGLDQHRTFMTSQILCWILFSDGSQQLCQNSNTNWKVFSFSGWEDVCCRLQSQPQPGCLDRRAWWLVGTDAGFNSIQKSFYWFQFWESLGGATSGAFKSGFVRFHPSGQVRQTTWRPSWAFDCHAAIEPDPVFQENKKKTTQYNYQLSSPTHNDTMASFSILSSLIPMEKVLPRCYARLQSDIDEFEVSTNIYLNSFVFNCQKLFISNMVWKGPQFPWFLNFSFLQVREDDVWISSFPKCGTTWTQVLCIGSNLVF